MALATNTDFDVRITGDNANGGGWDTDSAGTDRSQQDAAHVVVDGVTITATVHTTTTQLNIVGHTVATADIGNVFNITGGTVAVQHRQISSVDTLNNRWTMEAAVGTAGQTATGRMGGAKAHPAAAMAVLAAGNKIWLKYSATPYDITTTSSNVAGGRILFNVSSATTSMSGLIGYESTHGDLSSNRPTIRSTVASATPMIDMNPGNYVRIENIILDGNGQTSTIGLRSTSALGVFIHRVRSTNCTSFAFQLGASTNKAFDCEALNNDDAVASFGFVSAGAVMIGCRAKGNRNAGFADDGGSTYIYCIANGQVSGGSSEAGHGFFGSTGNGGSKYINCTAYGNNASGFDFASTTIAGALFMNCISYGNTDTGITSESNNYARAILYNVAMGANTGGNFGTLTGDNYLQLGDFITLTADPFTNAAGDDFSLNSSAGGGTLLRGQGWPGSILGTSTTGFPDVGAIQVEDTQANAVFVLSQTTSAFTSARGAIGY